MNEQQVYFHLPPDMLALLAASGQATETNITPEIIAAVNADGIFTVVGTRLGNATNIDGTGMLAAITFEVLEVRENILELQNVELGASLSDSEAELIPTDVENGAVVVPEIKGDVNNDGKVGSDDAILALHIAVGLRVPTDYEKSAADMNDDGRIGADDALMILQKAAGLTAPGMDVATVAGRQITVTLAESHGIAGESVTVPVNVRNTYGLAGGNISIHYDQTVLRAVDVSFDPGVLSVCNLNAPGVVRIAFADAHGLGGKTLARIRFDILTDNPSPLAFKMLELYTLDALPLIPRGVDGEFTSWVAPPEHNALLQNFPNPFNPDTWIPYQIIEESNVSITIYSAVGKIVRQLDLGHRPAGVYRTQGRAAHWDGRNEAGELAVSGIYFVVLKAGGYQEIRRITLIR